MVGVLARAMIHCRLPGFAALALLLAPLAGCAPTIGRAIPVASRPLPLDPADPARDRIGRLRFMGAVAMTSPEPAFGSFSSLRWRDGRLWSVADTGWWFALTPREVGGRLVGVSAARVGPLLDTAGQRFPTKDAGDSESLTRSARGGWLIGFEQAHRIWRYPRLDRAAIPTGIDPVALLGPMERNHGIEAMAGDERHLFLCAEQVATPGRPNCLDGNRRLALTPEPPIDALGGVPTDADIAGGRTFILFRSYSPADGQGSALGLIERNGRFVALGHLRPPLTLENLEGLAVRRVGDRTWLYVINDNDNNPARPLNLLMKFELIE